ncbi:MAG: GvpL/GvpF family gas vesicle protein [Methylovulum sp.]|nr:GvpL/GvpF family gas vesicle protein [Methylovulum sp.]
MTVATGTPTTLAIYLYGFTLPGAAAPQVLGVDDEHPLSLYTHAGLDALVSSVALGDFTGEVGENNVQDLAWLTPRACRHALAIEKLMAQGPVYPVPFGTLFSNADALAQEMARRCAEVLAVLQYITGCQEWALEALLDRKQAVEALLAEGLHSGRFCLPESAGRRHLEEQKLRRTLMADLDGWQAYCLDLLQNDLQPLMRDFRSRRLLDDQVLHWAYLLPEGKVAAFLQQVEDISRRYESYGFSFRVTGPWAAYSFCQGTHP